MFSSIDKALVAVVMGLVYLANTFFNAGIILDPETVNGFIVGITPILVWLTPNKET